MTYHIVYLCCFLLYLVHKPEKEKEGRWRKDSVFDISSVWWGQKWLGKEHEMWNFAFYVHQSSLVEEEGPDTSQEATNWLIDAWIKEKLRWTIQEIVSFNFNSKGMFLFVVYGRWRISIMDGRTKKSVKVASHLKRGLDITGFKKVFVSHKRAPLWFYPCVFNLSSLLLISSILLRSHN